MNLMYYKNIKKIIISLVAIFVLFLILISTVSIVFYGNDSSEKVSTEQKLITLMPTPPTGMTLVKEGFNPEARCFDKCGHYDRTYRFTSTSEVCPALVDSAQKDTHGYALNNRYSGSNVSLSAAECTAELNKYISMGIVPIFSYSLDTVEVVYIIIDDQNNTLTYSIDETAKSYYDKFNNLK